MKNQRWKSWSSKLFDIIYALSATWKIYQCSRENFQNTCMLNICLKNYWPAHSNAEYKISCKIYRVQLNVSKIGKIITSKEMQCAHVPMFLSGFSIVGDLLAVFSRRFNKNQLLQWLCLRERSVGELNPIEIIQGNLEIATDFWAVKHFRYA